MVKTSFQYYQFLYALKNSEAVQDATGSWDTTGGSWELKAACREETNGKGSAIQTADGRALVFSSLIQLPAGTARIDEGTEVMVTREEVDPKELFDQDFIARAKASGLVITTGTCAKFDAGRLHCRMWI